MNKVSFYILESELMVKKKISLLGFPGGSVGKEFAYNEGNLGLIPGWEDPLEHGTTHFQYSGQENSMKCIAHGVTKSQTRLRDFHDKIKSSI